MAPDKEAQYLKTLEYDLSELEYMVSLPHSPGNGRPVSEVDVQIDQAFLGSCTNGRIEDLRIAAKLIKGKPRPSIRQDDRCACQHRCLRTGIEGRPSGNLCKGRRVRLRTDVCRVSGRSHGSSGKGGEMRLFYEPELHRKDGAQGLRSLSSESRGGYCQCGRR